jgi:pilus assembly protein FimV
MKKRDWIVIGTLAVFTGLLAAPLAWAVSLGDIAVHSSLSQRFRAEIPISGLERGQLEKTRVKVAPLVAFQKADMQRSNILDAFRFKKTGRKIVITSTKPVQRPVVNFLLEVATPSGEHLTRQYTVLLNPPGETASAGAMANTSDAPATTGGEVIKANSAGRGLPKYAAPPQTAPVFTPLPRAEKNSQVTAASLPASKGREHLAHKRPPKPSAKHAPRKTVRHYGPVKRHQTLWSIAEEIRPVGYGITMDQMLMALYKANPGAFKGGINSLRTDSKLHIPDVESIRAIDAGRAHKQVAAQIRAYHQQQSAQTAVLKGDMRRLAKADTEAGSPASQTIKTTDSVKQASAGKKSGAVAGGGGAGATATDSQAAHANAQNSPASKEKAKAALVSAKPDKVVEGGSESTPQEPDSGETANIAQARETAVLESETKGADGGSSAGADESKPGKKTEDGGADPEKQADTQEEGAEVDQAKTGEGTSVNAADSEATKTAAGEEKTAAAGDAPDTAKKPGKQHNASNSQSGGGLLGHIRPLLIAVVILLFILYAYRNWRRRREAAMAEDVGYIQTAYPGENPSGDFADVSMVENGNAAQHQEPAESDAAYAFDDTSVSSEPALHQSPADDGEIDTGDPYQAVLHENGIRQDESWEDGTRTTIAGNVEEDSPALGDSPIEPTLESDPPEAPTQGASLEEDWRDQPMEFDLGDDLGKKTPGPEGTLLSPAFHLEEKPPGESVPNADDGAGDASELDAFLGSGSADDMATKLDLARVYIEMDCPDMADPILDGVMEQGNDAQRREAEALRERLK